MELSQHERAQCACHLGSGGVVAAQLSFLCFHSLFFLDINPAVIPITHSIPRGVGAARGLPSVCQDMVSFLRLQCGTSLKACYNQVRCSPDLAGPEVCRPWPYGTYTGGMQAILVIYVQAMEGKERSHMPDTAECSHLDAQALGPAYSVLLTTGCRSDSLQGHHSCLSSSEGCPQ